jgi:citronellol/citronellal dehydrogenase
MIGRHMGGGATSEIFARGALAGQVVLITGGGTGLGKASALELTRCGAGVVIAGRREEVLEEAVGEISAAVGWDAGIGVGGPPGRQVSAIAGDIRDPESAARLVDVVLERHGRLDALVNNAGGQYFVPAEEIVAKGWRAVWNLNVNGTLNMARAAVERAMRPAGRGTILNVTLSPHHGMPGMTHSAAARSAVEALTREMALEWGADGVVAVAVAAGHFATEATQKYPEVVRAGAARSVPLGRLGLVEEHAWLIGLLVSPLGCAFNGSVVTLDGARDNWFGPWPPSGMVDEAGQVPTEERRAGANG